MRDTSESFVSVVRVSRESSLNEGLDRLFQSYYHY